jgi:nitroreductase
MTIESINEGGAAVGSATGSVVEFSAGSVQLHCDTAARAADDQDFGMAQALIGSRRNVSPKRLVEPGPSCGQLEAMFALAAAAPDHGLLTPWRFVVVPQSKRALLAEVFALALIDRDPGATLLQIEAARDKAYRAPLLMVAVVRLASDHAPEIPDVERIVSLGCAVQNLLLAAHAMGYGSGLTSGQAMASSRLRELFRLDGDERAVCFVNLGTVTKQKPARIRPAVGQFVSTL